MKKQKSKKNDKSPIELHEDYIAFLKKRLASENYKANVSQQEYDKTKAKYDKAKLKLKFMKM